MRKVVVDASVAVKWYFRERESDAALQLLADDALELIGPEILVTEVANALLRRERENLLSASVTDDALKDLGRALSIPMRTNDLLVTAIRVSRELLHPLPDCVYLALAQLMHAQLVTADEKFDSKARAHQPDTERLILLSEYQAR